MPRARTSWANAMAMVRPHDAALAPMCRTIGTTLSHRGTTMSASKPCAVYDMDTESARTGP